MKMPKEIKNQWVKALRSGEYKQAKNTLYDPDSEGYCCLGVLQMVCDGKVETENDEEYEDRSTDFPTYNWFKDHKIDLSFIKGEALTNTLVEMNDGLGREQSNFCKIADWIEKNVEVTDNG